MMAATSFDPELLKYMTADEIAELDNLIANDPMPWRPLAGPQLNAYYADVDILGYGGAAGGGKTDLAAGKVLTQSERALFIRREKAQTEGLVQRLTEILGSSDGLNAQKGIWRIPNAGLLELGGLDNLGDERRWQGRPHDKKIFDEVTEMRESQVRFIMGWNRTSNKKQKAQTIMTFNPPTTSDGRWVIDFFGPWLDKNHPLYPTMPGVKRYAAMVPGKDGNMVDTWLDRPDKFVLINGALCYDFNPKDYAPEDIIEPKSRTFIPARVTDNIYYMESGYMSTLQSMPEPLRSQMLYGDFQAGIEDDPWQVIPTAWIEAAMARWSKPHKLPEMDSVGVDVARGGKDNTIIACRHDMWFDEPKTYPGSQTPDGPKVAGLSIAAQRDQAPIHIDVIGVGSSPFDFLKEAGIQVLGINVAEASHGFDKSGRLTFMNLRSELYWRMREALDPANNTGIALPPDNRLKADLCAPTWKLQGSKIVVAGREEIISKVGRSPDYASAYILALIDTPKARVMKELLKANRRNSGGGGYAGKYDAY